MPDDNGDDNGDGNGDDGYPTKPIERDTDEEED